MPQKLSLVMVGSVGLDDIETPRAKRTRVLGGSASYATVAASFFTPPGMVGVCGRDMPEEYMDLLRRLGVDLSGLQIKDGLTFHWSGVYAENMNERRTLRTDLNVFAGFSPELPDAYRKAPYLFLGNITPALQAHVLDQMESPRFVMADTMDLWINTARDDLMKVLPRVTMITVNESEARLLTGEYSLMHAARRMLAYGPRYVVVKKGEHGSMLFSRDGLFLIPAYPVDNVQDPTGAGDTFAGGFMGALAMDNQTTEAALRRALVYGNIVASFGVEAFSLDRYASLSRADLDERFAAFQRMTAF